MDYISRSAVAAWRNAHDALRICTNTSARLESILAPRSTGSYDKQRTIANWQHASARARASDADYLLCHQAALSQLAANIPVDDGTA